MIRQPISSWAGTCQTSAYQPTIYQIIGFDRLNFVEDVANAVPQDECCRILSLSFEGDGVRVEGRLMVQVGDAHYRMLIDRQLRAIQGLVSVKQTA